MIAKHLPMKVAHKSHFGELVRYLTDPQDTQERVGRVQITHCHSLDSDWAIREVLATQAKNTRATSDKSYHLLLSFPPGETPSEAVLEDIESRVCVALGYGEHQRVSVVHHDTDSLHVHLAINKIHPERLTLHEPYLAYKTLGEICTLLEIEHGLQQVDHHPRKSRSQNKAGDMEQMAGIESLMSWIQRECLDELEQSRTWDELHNALQKNGLDIQLRGAGFVITDTTGTRVKASSVSRSLSKKNLESRLGLFKAADEERGRGAPSKKYTFKPMPSRINTVELYARYQAEKIASYSVRDIQWAKVRDKKNRLIKEAKQKGRLKRAAIKLLGDSGIVKKIQYGLCSQQLQKEIQAINSTYVKERAVIYAKYKRSTWNDWLKEKALVGDKEALMVLRAKSERSLVTGDVVFGHAANSSPPISHMTPDVLTKNGTLIYHAGASAVRDDGYRLSVSREITQAGLEAALRMAMQRYGEQITISGSDVFKEGIVHVASALKLPVIFNDAQLEQKRRTLLQVENQAVNTASADRAVDVFIAERESKRLKGMDVPHYRRYHPQDDKGDVIYTGTRFVEGHALALLKKGDSVIVLPIDTVTAHRMKRMAVGKAVILMANGTITSMGRSR